MDTENIERRHLQALDKVDVLTSEIYALGAASERVALTDRLRELIHVKQMSHDDIACDVLGWALEHIADND
jgi:hypothetical protein